MEDSTKVGGARDSAGRPVSKLLVSSSHAIKLAPAVNGAKKPKSPAHAARRASAQEASESLDDSQLRRPPMIRVDSLTSVRTDT